jgi:hypothetical protein
MRVSYEYGRRKATKTALYVAEKEIVRLALCSKYDLTSVRTDTGLSTCGQLNDARTELRLLDVGDELLGTLEKICPMKQILLIGFQVK